MDTLSHRRVRTDSLVLEMDTCISSSLSFIFCHRANQADFCALASYLYNWLARPIAGGTLAANQAAAAQGGAPEPTAGAAPPGMNVRECGSGVGIVML